MTVDDLKTQAIGITRPLDQVGRVVIPKDIRENMKWDTGDKVQFFKVEGGLLLVKSEEEED